MISADGEVRELLARWATAPARAVSALTAADVRRDDRAILDLQRQPGELHSVTDVEIPGPAGALRVRVYRPYPGRLRPLLFLHGGGFVIGGGGYEAPLHELALSSGCLIVSPDVRLAPENPFPAALEDAVAAAQWLDAHTEPLGASSTPPTVAGDSSGGNLAATITSHLVAACTPPAAQILIYPMLDATASSPSYRQFAEGYGFTSAKSCWYFDQYLPPGTDRRSSRVSPLFADALGDLPPTLIVTAECDPLRDDGERYAQALRHAGVTVELRRYPGMIHGFFQMTGALEASRQLYSDINVWIRHALDHAAPPDSRSG